jgi:hypothetical protein
VPPLLVGVGVPARALKPPLVLKIVKTNLPPPPPTTMEVQQPFAHIGEGERTQNDRFSELGRICYRGIPMALSDTVRHQAESLLRVFCERRVPVEVRDKINLTYEFRGNSVTLIENRPGFRDPGKWTAMSIAQFRFDPKNGKWTLYCADRNSKWHEYGDIEPTSRFEFLLEEVDKDPTGIFFG